MLLLLGLVVTTEVHARKPAGAKLDKVLFEYSSNIRWSEYETAWTFVDPVYRLEHPNAHEIERLKQFRVSGYLVKIRETISKVEYGQVVEVRLINRHTQIEKVVTARELWRWDAEGKRWWLTTGLPELNQD